ncbi:hypothetical protein [Burkholderia ubonensis]|uniref:hypothetical protein n=1 Tax=Burkholderia ubonensis TaxID=101571 RepID=UPI0012F75215|nr:hypothetical protein [Burkholderia ubonensis]
MPFAIGSGLACSVLYDMLKFFAEQVHFHDSTAAKVSGMQARLRLELDFAIDEVADFVEVFAADPAFVRNMKRAMLESAQHSAMDDPER